MKKTYFVWCIVYHISMCALYILCSYFVLFSSFAIVRKYFIDVIIIMADIDWAHRHILFFILIFFYLFPTT